MATTAFFTNQYFTTTLNVGGGINNSQTTGITISSVSGLDITKPGIALVNYADPLVTTTAEWVTYTSIDGSNELQGVSRGAEGFSAKSHDNGVSIAFPLSESHINNLATALSIGGVAINMVEGVLDEDDMGSDSATKLATQQSIKAYVDSNSSTPPGDVNGESVLSSTFSITSANGTFDDTGLSITIPSAGTYEIYGSATCKIQFSAGGDGYIVGKLYNSTDTADVANSERLLGFFGSSGVQYRSATSFSTIITVTEETTIKLYAKSEDGTTWTFRDILSDANGRTNLGYIKIDN